MKEFVGGLIIGIIGIIGVYLKSYKKTNPSQLISHEEETKIYDHYQDDMKKVYDKNPQIKTREDVLKELNRYRDVN